MIVGINRFNIRRQRQPEKNMMSPAIAVCYINGRSPAFWIDFPNIVLIVKKYCLIIGKPRGRTVMSQFLSYVVIHIPAPIVMRAGRDIALYTGRKLIGAEVL